MSYKHKPGGQKHKNHHKKHPRKGKDPGKGKPKLSKYARIDQTTTSLRAQYESYNSEAVQSFQDLPLSSETLAGLKEAGYTVPTQIQRESIVLALQGNDILGAAKTGSGKTLAFLVPLLEKLYSAKWSQTDGVGALVITPTRELAYQIFEVLRTIGSRHDFSAGLIIGGKDLKFEWSRVSGCNILICTPGRLLQHLDENPSFSVDNLQLLVLDEADRCLDLGFSTAINSIVASFPAGRQTLLFSATQTRTVSDLARLSLTSPVLVSVHENSAVTTPDNLRQSFIVTPAEHKINILWSFLKSHRRKKIVVFVASCKQTKYYQEIFSKLKPGMSVMGLYGTLPQLRRMAIYDNFSAKDAAVLFATDIAARGLDFPKVDWVVQLDCPEDATTYTHRVGRTGRNERRGEGLLVLTETEEQEMVRQLGEARIPIEKIEINSNKMRSITGGMAAFLAGDKNLKESAQRAFVSYIKSVVLMKNKKIFDVASIELDKFAESLGLAATPRVRFLQRQTKKTVKAPGDKEDEVEAAKVSEQKMSFVGQEDESEGEDEMFSVKRADHEIEDDHNEDEDEDPTLGLRKDGRVITKAHMAKKLLKKKIGNTKTVFDDEGDVIADSSKQKLSKEGQDYEAETNENLGGGINIEKAKEVLKAEDKFDKVSERARIKEKKREEKRKLKEENRRLRAEKKSGEGEDDEEVSGEEETEPDLSWLPDPDKIYGEKAESESDSESEEEKVEIKDKKRSLTVIKSVIPSKKRRLAESSSEDDLSDDDDDDDDVLDTGLSLGDDEDLALKLLSQ